MVFSTDQNYQINKYFKLYELVNKKYVKDNEKVNIDDELITKLYLLRELINKPIYVTSGYRTVEQNKDCGGAPSSYHLTGQAVDIFSSIDNQLLGLAAARVGFNGIIYYSTYTHIDTRKTFYYKKGENIIYGDITNI